MSVWREAPKESECSSQGLCQCPLGTEAWYHWHHYRKPWQTPHSQSTPEQPLDRYKWKTSARLTPSAAQVAALEGRGHDVVEPVHLRLLSLPRRFTAISSSSLYSGPAQQGHQGRPGSLRRLIPFHRSASEPGAGSSPEKTVLRKVGSDAEQNEPFVSNILSLLSRRIGRILSNRDEPDPESQVSGRRAPWPCFYHPFIMSLLVSCCSRRGGCRVNEDILHSMALPCHTMFYVEFVPFQRFT